MKTTTNLTEKEIREKYRTPGTLEVNTCLAYYRELHKNGHFDTVERFLLKGDRSLGQQGYTWENTLKELTEVKGKDFFDPPGAYAGTFYIYYYNGKEVYKKTRYSLFQ